LVDVFHSYGTFDRLTFFGCLKSLIKSGKVEHYPGRYSVWVIDGAAIHLDRNIVLYVRSFGIYIFFLPAYCPFYSPIEYVFGFIKGYLQEQYEEIPGSELKIISDSFMKYSNYDLHPTFEHCGYGIDGVFDPTKNMKAWQ